MICYWFDLTSENIYPNFQPHKKAIKGIITRPKIATIWYTAPYPNSKISSLNPIFPFPILRSTKYRSRFTIFLFPVRTVQVDEGHPLGTRTSWPPIEFHSRSAFGPAGERFFDCPSYLLRGSDYQQCRKQSLQGVPHEVPGCQGHPRRKKEKNTVVFMKGEDTCIRDCFMHLNFPKWRNCSLITHPLFIYHSSIIHLSLIHYSLIT